MTNAIIKTIFQLLAAVIGCTIGMLLFLHFGYSHELAITLCFIGIAILLASNFIQTDYE